MELLVILASLAFCFLPWILLFILINLFLFDLINYLFQFHFQNQSKFIHSQVVSFLLIIKFNLNLIVFMVINLNFLTIQNLFNHYPDSNLFIPLSLYFINTLYPFLVYFKTQFISIIHIIFFVLLIFIFQFLYLSLPSAFFLDQQAYLPRTYFSNHLLLV